MTDRAMLTPAGNRTTEETSVVEDSHVVNGPPGSELVRGATTYVPKPTLVRCPKINQSGSQCKGKVWPGHEMCSLHEYFKEKDATESAP